jgi:hypothetical protein
VILLRAGLAAISSPAHFVCWEGSFVSNHKTVFQVLDNLMERQIRMEIDIIKMVYQQKAMEEKLDEIYRATTVVKGEDRQYAKVCGDCIRREGRGQEVSPLDPS